MGHHLGTTQTCFNPFLQPPHAIGAQSARRCSFDDSRHQLHQSSCQTASAFAKVAATMPSARSRNSKNFRRVDRRRLCRNLGRKRDHSIQVRDVRFGRSSLNDGEHGCAFHFRLSARARRHDAFSRGFHSGTAKTVAGRSTVVLTPCNFGDSSTLLLCRKPLVLPALECRQESIHVECPRASWNRHVPAGHRIVNRLPVVLHIRRVP